MTNGATVAIMIHTACMKEGEVVPRNKYPEETVQKILDAALKLFLEKGYEQTTVLDIVGHMGGLTRGAFYHHFKSKEEVLDALTDRLFYENNPFEKAKRQKNLTGIEKLRYLVLLSTEESESRKVTVMSAEVLQKSPTFLKRMVDDNRDVVAPMYRELIEEGVRDGSIQTAHPKLLAELLVLLTNFWMIPTLFPVSAEEALERFLYVKEVTDKMGLPLFDDEIVKRVLENLQLISLG